MPVRDRPGALGCGEVRSTAETGVTPAEGGGGLCGGGKGPQFQGQRIRGEGHEIGKPITSKQVQKLRWRYDAKAGRLVREPAAGNCLSASIAGCGKGAMVEPRKARQTKGAATDSYTLMPTGTFDSTLRVF